MPEQEATDTPVDQLELLRRQKTGKGVWYKHVAALVASAWRVMSPATVSLPTGAHVDAGDAEATKAPSKKCSPFHYTASETSFGTPAKITERFLRGY